MAQHYTFSHCLATIPHTLPCTLSTFLTSSLTVPFATGVQVAGGKPVHHPPSVPLCHWPTTLHAPVPPALNCCLPTFLITHPYCLPFPSPIHAGAWLLLIHLVTHRHHPPSHQLIETMPYRKKAVSWAHAQQGTLRAWFNKSVNQDEGLESEYIPESESDEELERSSKFPGEETASETEVNVKEAMSNLSSLFCPQSSCGHLTNAERVTRALREYKYSHRYLQVDLWENLFLWITHVPVPGT